MPHLINFQHKSSHLLKLSREFNEINITLFN